jgi:uncharacterized protein YecT (DUF1311 family)
VQLRNGDNQQGLLSDYFSGGMVMRAIVLGIVVIFSLFIRPASAQEYTQIGDGDIALFPKLVTSPTCVKGCSITSPAENGMMFLIKPMPVENGLAEYYWIIKAGGKCHPQYGCPGMLFAHYQGRWLPRTYKHGTTEELVRSWIVESEAELAQSGAQSTATKTKTAEVSATADSATDKSQSLECSKQADAQGIHGVERRDFITQCKGSTAPNSPPEASLSYVANTEPPDAYLSLRTDPASSRGQRIMSMPNGTLLEVLKRQPDGWWNVRVVPTGQTGWALSSSREKRWIECCKIASGGETSVASTESEPSSNKPSFNCSTAKTGSARLICSDAELSNIDRALGVAFQNAIRTLEGDAKKSKVQEQITWIRERNSRCKLDGKLTVPVEELVGSKPCMLSWINIRIGELTGSTASSSGPAVAAANGAKYKVCADTATACIRGCSDDAACEATCNSTFAVCKKDLPESAKTTSDPVVSQSSEKEYSTTSDEQSDFIRWTKTMKMGIKCDGFYGDGYDFPPVNAPLMRFYGRVDPSINIREFVNPTKMDHFLIHLYDNVKKTCDDQIQAGKVKGPRLQSMTIALDYDQYVDNAARGGASFGVFTQDGKQFSRIQRSNGATFSEVAALALKFDADQVNARQAQQAAQEQAARTLAQRRATAEGFASAHPITASGPYSSEVLQCARGIFTKSGVSMPMFKEEPCSDYMNLYDVTTVDSREIPGGIEVVSQITLQVAQPIVSDSMMAQACYGGTKNNLNPGDKVTVNSRLRFENWNSGLRCTSTTWQ